MPQAKRRLTDINFNKEGAHVALVSKDLGGPANGHNYSMLIKATNSSEEFLKKVQQMQELFSEQRSLLQLMGTVFLLPSLVVFQ
jgi:hypothetical protein